MVDPIKPKRTVSQAPIKFTTCHSGCGAQVEYRTNPRVYCSPCKVDKVRADARASMEKQRRKRGVPEIKGTVRPCEDCGTGMVLNRNGKARVCQPCRTERMKERARRVSLSLTGVPGSRVRQGQLATAKRKVSPRHAINFRFKAAIRRVLNGGKKARKWESLVGYTLSDLMDHLEKQFLKGMAWDNRGEWEIDHIIALADFNFDSAEHPDFKAAWALSNLRPIWADDNRKKNRTRTHLI